MSYVEFLSSQDKNCPDVTWYKWKSTSVPYKSLSVPSSDLIGSSLTVKWIRDVVYIWSISAVMLCCNLTYNPHFVWSISVFSFFSKVPSALPRNRGQKPNITPKGGLLLKMAAPSEDNKTQYYGSFDLQTSTSLICSVWLHSRLSTKNRY